MTLQLPLLPLGLAIRICDTKQDNPLSAPALESPWLLANFHFGCFSARGNFEHPLPPCSDARPRQSCCIWKGEARGKHHPGCTLWVWHLMVEAFPGFPQSPDVPAPALVPVLLTRSGRALHSPSVGWRRCCPNNPEKQNRAPDTKPFIPALPQSH